MNIKFNLKEPNKSESLILMFCRWNGNLIKLSTRHRVQCNTWNKEKQRCSNKYQGKFPHLCDKGSTNDHLRECGRHAKINEVIRIVENRGGKVQTLTFKKYQLIGMHTGRCSFATNMYKPSNPQPPSKNDIELKEKEATQKKRLKEVKIATRRHKIPLPHNAT